MSLARPALVRQPSRERILPEVPKNQRRGGMSVAEAFRLSLQSLVTNKLRSLLTMLGIIIGVGSVIVMVALGQGAAAASQAAIEKLGTNLLTIMPASQNRGGVSQGLGSSMTLRPEDVDVIRKMAPSVASISAEYRGSAQVQFEGNNTKTTVQGATPEYFDIHNMPIARGRGFTAMEMRSKAKVAVLGDSVRETLFPGRRPINKEIRVNGQNFKVIGVVAKRGGGGFRSPDDQITIPLTTAMRRVFGVDYLSTITVQAVSPDKMDEAQDEIMRAIGKAHNLPSGAQPDVRVFNQADITESAAAQSGFLTMLLAGIALVSLIVGGIGIMNIMLVTVTERTREVGIRKAIGAKRKDVLYQFLIESVTISVVGGLMGVLIGVGLALWMGRPADRGGLGFPMLLSPTPMLLSFGFSALVGIFFGIYPAMNAASLNPIQALRTE
jgi:putative ABC transport system permease protein